MILHFGDEQQNGGRNTTWFTFLDLFIIIILFIVVGYARITGQNIWASVPTLLYLCSAPIVTAAHLPKGRDNTPFLLRR